MLSVAESAEIVEISESVEPFDSQPFMIHEILIENFRCFSKAVVQDLALINVIVGSNAAGKTAFLESIFLGACGTLDVFGRLRQWRGLGNTAAIPINPGMPLQNMNLLNAQAQYKSIVRDFSNNNNDKPLSISLIGDDKTTRELQIIRDYTNTPEYLLGTGAPSGSGSYNPPRDPNISVTFTGDHQTASYRLTPSGTYHAIKNQTVKPINIFIVPSSFPAVSPSEPAIKLSELNRRGEEKKLLATVSDIFPEITNLSVGVEDNNVSVIYCNIPGDPNNRKLPALMISSGISKILSILLSIATTGNGIVLIDEIENGLYYETQKKIWNAIYTFAITYKTQIFVTTHSEESLRSLMLTIKGNEDQFRLIRLEQKAGHRHIRIFKGENFEAALESGYEVR